jgi:DNA-binding protein YbaB
MKDLQMNIQEVSFEESEKMGLVDVDMYLTGHVFKEDLYDNLKHLQSMYPKVKFYILKPRERYGGYYRIRADKILAQYELLECYKNNLETIPDLIDEAQKECVTKIKRLMISQADIQMKIEVIEKKIKES